MINSKIINIKLIIEVSFIIFIILLNICRSSIFAQSVIIGNQEWMTENLNVDHFRNGDLIPEVKTKEEWVQYCQQGKACWCYYNNDPDIGRKYGKIYNWFAMTDEIAPTGWHIPNNTEWLQLMNDLGGFKVAGEGMKSISDWKNNGNGTNNSGFGGYPCGWRDDFGDFYITNSSFVAIGYQVGWWSSSIDLDSETWAFWLFSDSNGLWRGGSYGHGMYIRCIKD